MRTCKIVAFAIPADHIIRMKECENSSERPSANTDEKKL